VKSIVTLCQLPMTVVTTSKHEFAVGLLTRWLEVSYQVFMYELETLGCTVSHKRSQFSKFFVSIQSPLKMRGIRGIPHGVSPPSFENPSSIDHIVPNKDPIISFDELCKIFFIKTTSAVMFVMSFYDKNKFY
jgi:hypothetical protein